MNSFFTESVFLVDDDEDDRFLAQQVFFQYNPHCELTSLANGQELLLALERTANLPSLILLDLNMPLMNGLEVLDIIRQQRCYDAIPVIILTTSDQSADRQAAFKAKADGFITKPVSIEGLNQVVLQVSQRWLAGKR